MSERSWREIEDARRQRSRVLRNVEASMDRDDVSGIAAVAVKYAITAISHARGRSLRPMTAGAGLRGVIVLQDLLNVARGRSESEESIP